MKSPALNPRTRTAALEEMAHGHPLDLLVVGGGITGAGIALDAATRGLKVGIIEAQDWGSGTSSRSSKLVHGGLRYLYQLDFKLVSEALRERGLLIEKLAPHLVKGQPFMWPLRDPYVQRALSAAGIAMYDAMAQWSHRGTVPLQKHYSAAGAAKRIKSLDESIVRGAIEFYDARVDDARLVLGVVRTAVRFGALAANRTQAVRFLRESTGERRVYGAEIWDAETDRRFEVRAKRVIIATGVWTEQTQRLAGTDVGGLRVLTSKGIHIVVPRDRIEGSAGIFSKTEKSVLFIIPWKRYWLIGTTDTEYRANLRHPVANADDIDYVIDHANALLNPAKHLTRDDVIASSCGLRPLLEPRLLDESKRASTKVSREHMVTQVAPGLSAIAGGKLTTYRPMAEDAVDFALGPKLASDLPSKTIATPLVGADGYFALWNARQRLADESRLSQSHIEDLLDRYGSETLELLEMIKSNPSLGKELDGAPWYLRAEVAFGVLFEGALHLEDILMSRLRLNLECEDRGIHAAQDAVKIAGELLEWDAERMKFELENYLNRVHAVMRAETLRDADLAQAARDSAPDITPMHES